MKKYFWVFTLIVGSANSSAGPLELWQRDGSMRDVDALDPDVKEKVTVTNVSDAMSKREYPSGIKIADEERVNSLVKVADEYINAKRKEAKDLRDDNNYLSTTLKGAIDTNSNSIEVNKQKVGAMDSRLNSLKAEVDRNTSDIVANKNSVEKATKAVSECCR